MALSALIKNEKTSQTCYTAAHTKKIYKDITATSKQRHYVLTSKLTLSLKQFNFANVFDRLS